MADAFTGMTPVTLAEWQALVPEGNTQINMMIQTIRDYQAFFDRATLVRGNDGQGKKGLVGEKYPEGQLVGLNEGWSASNVQHVTVLLLPRTCLKKCLTRSAMLFACVPIRCSYAA